MNKCILVMLSFLVSLSCKAFEDRRCTFSDCVPSKSTKLDGNPGFAPTYNDLTRTSGGFIDEYMNRIILRGQVVDKKCLPVSNANITIWQQDEYGAYRYSEYLSTPEKQYVMDNDSYSKFQGAGVTSSDNEGRFIFITVIPNKENYYNNDDEVINMSVNARDLSIFNTKLLFRTLENSKDNKKSSMGIVAKFNKEATDFYGIDVYDFSVVLDGLNKDYRY